VYYRDAPLLFAFNGDGGCRYPQKSKKKQKNISTFFEKGIAFSKRVCYNNIRHTGV